jgi:hypothetical protein
VMQIGCCQSNQNLVQTPAVRPRVGHRRTEQHTLKPRNPGRLRALP